MLHHDTSRFLFPLSLLGLFALLVLGTTLCFADPTYMPDCEGPGCLRTAEAANWPAPLGKAAYTVELERYIVSLPSLPKRTVLDRAGTLIVQCQDGSFLSFDLESTYALADDIEAPEKSNFTVSDSGTFVFTKTASDPPPTDPADLWVWKQAIFLKEQVFGPKNPVYQSTKGPLTVYYWPDFQIKEASLAHVFDTSRPDTYVRIFAKKMTFDDFKKIVGSIQIRNK